MSENRLTRIEELLRDAENRVKNVEIQRLKARQRFQLAPMVTWPGGVRTVCCGNLLPQTMYLRIFVVGEPFPSPNVMKYSSDSDSWKCTIFTANQPPVHYEMFCDPPITLRITVEGGSSNEHEVEAIQCNPFHAQWFTLGNDILISSNYDGSD